jgi:ferredoxin/flavodoxin---NADP+ reductase
MAKGAEYIKGDQYLFKNTVLKNVEIAEGKFLISFEKQFGFKAGNVVAIALNNSIEPRIYSVCSGETDPEMQVLFDLNPVGMLTPELAKLKIGDTLFVSKPYGSFLPETEQPMWWIATGTGISPFRSMLRSGFIAQKMVHGARIASNFYFDKEFKLALKENYIRCNSGTDGAGEYSGRVTLWIDCQTDLPVLNKYYLCGRALMVVELRDLLISKGIRYENIISEIFF